MELQELKSIWVACDKQAEDVETLNRLALSSSIRARSEMVISRLDRTMKKKTFMAILTGVVALFLVVSPWVSPDQDYLFDNIFGPQQMSSIFFLMGMIVFIGAYYNWKAHQKILDLQKTTVDLRNSLKESINVLVHVQNLKIISDAFGAPFFSIWAIVVVVYGHEGFTIDHRFPPLILTSVTLVVVSYFVAKKANSFYQKFIEQMRQYLDELEDQK